MAIKSEIRRTSLLQWSMRPCGNPRGSEVTQVALRSSMRENVCPRAIPMDSVVQDGLKMLGIRGICMAFY